MSHVLAPCIAIAGPANAGKTTLLHQLDQKLQRKLSSVLVIKGNPDGTGRYLFHNPDLRDVSDFKTQVKGQWGNDTVDRICEWIAHGRRNLQLALLDFGGKHSEQNHRMLRACSHYIIVSREDDFVGGDSWDQVCQQDGLQRVARMFSIGPVDSPEIRRSAPDFEGTFQYTAGPEDEVNDAVLDPLVDLLVHIARPAEAAPYIDLKFAGGEWTEDMISTVAGRDRAIRDLANAVGAVVVGGRAPVWAYLAALSVALKANPQARVFFFDPKQPQRLIEIPSHYEPQTDFPVGVLGLRWEQPDVDGWNRLILEIKTSDKFLPSAVAQNLSAVPHFGSIPGPRIGLSVPGPTWLFGTYARWLAHAGAEAIASWDGRQNRFIRVWQ